MTEQIEEITPSEQAALDALEARGFYVVVWTPEEVGQADIGALNEVVTLAGNHFLDDANNRDEEEEGDESND